MIGILGASGTVGHHLTRALSGRSESVRALVHRPESAELLSELPVTVRVGDIYDDAVLRDFLDGVDQLFLSTAVTSDQHVLQKHIIDVAKEVGVKGITKLSAWTAAEDSVLNLSRQHDDVERYLAMSGLPYTILQSHTFIQTLANIYSYEIANQSSMTTSVALDSGIYMVDARDVADVAAEVLSRADHSGKTLVLHGPDPLSYFDCSQKIEAALGRPINYVQITDDEMRSRFLAAGLDEHLTDAFVTLFQMYSSGQYEPELNDNIPSLTGHAARSFDDYTRSEDFTKNFA